MQPSPARLRNILLTSPSQYGYLEKLLLPTTRNGRQQKNAMRYPLLFTLVLFFTGNAFPQNLPGTVQHLRGIILAEDGIPLSNVTVSDMTSQKAVMSDSLGHYSISVPASGKLKFSAIGFVEKEVEVN